MNAPRCALIGCIPVLVLAVAGCELPRTRHADQVPDGAPHSATLLDPASPHVDLTKERLRVVWQHNLRDLARERDLRRIYLAEDLLTVETGDASLFHFNAASGVLKSATSLKTVLRHPPVMGADGLYVLTGRGLALLDPESGTMVRRMPLRVATTCMPSVFGSTLILGTGSGMLTRISDENAVPLWQVHADGPIIQPPIIDARNIYAVGLRGSVLAVTGAEGRLLWKWRPHRPSELLGGICMAERKVFVGDSRGFLYARTVDEGVVLWTIAIGAPITVAPAYFDGHLLVFTTRNEVMCIALGMEPSIVWTNSGIKRLVATGAETLYMLTDSDELLAIAKESGKEQWRRRLPPKCSVVSEPAGSRFYLYRADGAIVAIDELG